MKQLFILAIGILSTLGVAQAVDYESIYVPQDVEYAIEACSDFVTQTPLTQKIEEEDSFGKGFINPLRNLDRMERSIPEGECERPRARIQAFIGDFLFRINNGYKVPIYGELSRLDYFLDLPFVYYGGK